MITCIIIGSVGFLIGFVIGDNQGFLQACKRFKDL